MSASEAGADLAEERMIGLQAKEAHREWLLQREVAFRVAGADFAVGGGQGPPLVRSSVPHSRFKMTAG